MISKKLKVLYLISIIMVFIHGIEEYFTGLYTFDSFYTSFAHPRLVFVIIILILCNGFLALSYIAIQKGKFSLSFSVVLGVLLLYEFQHIIVSISHRDYTPGLITALSFPVLSILFWKELLLNLKIWQNLKKH